MGIIENKNKKSIIVYDSDINDLNFISHDSIMAVFKNCRLNIIGESKDNDVKAIKILSCQTDNLYFLKNFINLKCLIIKDTSITDIGSLSVITKLSSLIYNNIHLNNINYHLSKTNNLKYKIIQ